MSLCSAILFRGKLYKGDCHSDCLTDLLEDAVWPESYDALEAIIDDELEPLQWGHWTETRGFKAFDLDRSEAYRNYYIREGAR
jgi:hypothetical protein